MRKILKRSLNYHDAMKQSDTKMLACEDCGTKVRVNSDAISTKCFLCTAKLVPPPTHVKHERSPFPRGWKLYSEFVTKYGRVYKFGIEQPDLKGTLPPTDVEKIRAEQKERRKNRPSKKERERIKHEKLLKHYNKKQMENASNGNNKPFGENVPKTNKSLIVANVTMENGYYKAIGEDGVDYTNLVNNQKKLKYVFGKSKIVKGKKLDNGLYKWRG